MDRFQTLTIDGDAWFNVGLPRSWLVHTSVFLMLIVRPKLVQASANLSTFCCMSSTEMEFRAQLSANRKSLMVSVLTLVFAFSLLRLKTEPSIRCLMPMPMPMSVSAKASVNIAENIRLNSVGGQDTTLFYSIWYQEWFGWVSIILNSGHHSIV